MSGASDSIPRGFTRRTTVAVILVFLATMAVFLGVAFRSDRRLYYRATFEHLDEVLAVLSNLPELSERAARSSLGALEERLAEQTGAPHRVVLTDATFSITSASDDRLVGEDVRTHFNLVPYGPAGAASAFGSTDFGPWIGSSRPLGDVGGRVFLMRSRRGSEQFAGQFWRVHVLHVLVTVLLFALLLDFVGRRYVQRPIEQLAAHVRRLERGSFELPAGGFRNDEFGWLAERFSDMVARLEDVVRRLVRSEKMAAAGAVAYRVARGAVEPLGRMKRHIAYLESLAAGDPELTKVVAALEKDRWTLADAVLLLEKLAPPSDEPEDEQETQNE